MSEQAFACKRQHWMVAFSQLLCIVVQNFPMTFGKEKLGRSLWKLRCLKEIKLIYRDRHVKQIRLWKCPFDEGVVQVGSIV